MDYRNDCETCGHPTRGISPNGAPMSIAHGFERVLIGECDDCPKCIEIFRARVAEDRNARPAQYRPIE